MPQRYVIDFHPRSILEAKKYRAAFARAEKAILPARQKAAREEKKRNEEALRENPKAKVNRHHANFLARWWLLSYPRPELITRVNKLGRYIACARVTKRPIFEFVSSSIRPGDALMIFPFEDDYSFGILQSNFHWRWFTARCSTLKGDFRYTSETVFNSFVWPQNPGVTQVEAVAETAASLRQLRKRAMRDGNSSLRELYRSLELPGENPLRDAHEELDRAVCRAYGFDLEKDILAQLLELNLEAAKQERAGKPIQGPGLPLCVKNPASFITEDCVQPPDLNGGKIAPPRKRR